MSARRGELASEERTFVLFSVATKGHLVSCVETSN